MRAIPVTAAVPIATLDEVAAGAAADAGGLDPAPLHEFLVAVVDAVESGTQLGKAALRRCSLTGADAARSGIALRALLDLYLSAAWRLWRHLPTIAAAADFGSASKKSESPADASPSRADVAAVVTAGEVMLHAADDAVAALTEGYQLARRNLIRAEEAARREFIDDLLSGAGRVADLLERAAGFGLDLTGPHAVVVGEAAKPFSDAAPVMGQLERAVQGRKGDAEALVASKDGRLVVVFAAPNDTAVDYVLTQLGSVLARAKIARWQLGVGRAQPGASGVRTAYDEARDAVDLAGRLGLGSPVVRAADLLIYQVLLRDRAAITDLVEATLAPLRTARGGAEPLLQTLGAYFDAGGNSASAARALNLSVRAVTYRLDRVRSLSGHDPAQAEQRFALQVAVVGARLLNWPTLPESGN